MATTPQLIDSAETITVNMTINEETAEELASVGIRASDRNAEAHEYHREKYAGQAADIGRDAFRLGRTTTKGTPLPDSGRLMFGHEKAPGNGFTFEQLAECLKKAGFRLAGVNVLREDRRNRLFLNWKRVSEPAEQIDGYAVVLINRLLGETWGELQGFRNPDGRWNMNLRARVGDPKQLARLTDRRSVQMDRDGTFRLLKIRPAPPRPEAT